MTRNISIQEFINSLDEAGFSLFPNTLRYLYNADFQNGLYIDKSPTGGGSTVLNNLLILYRIAKYLTFGAEERENGYISIFDDHPDLAYPTFLRLLQSNLLFTESAVPEEDALLDQKHIYYKTNTKDLIRFCFSKNSVRVFFKNIRTTAKIDLPGTRVVSTEDFIKFFLGVMVTSTSAEINVQEKIVDWFDDVLNAGAFKHKNLRLNPFENAKIPFVILSKETMMTVSEKLTPVEFNGRDVIEINDLPFAKDFRGRVLPQDLRVGRVEVTTPFYMDGIVQDNDQLGLSTKEAFLRERYGLYKKWDYGIKVPSKEESHENVEEALSGNFDTKTYHLEDSDFQKEFGEMLSTDNTFAQLISNQSRYMETYLSGKDEDFKKNLFKELSKFFCTKIRNENELISYLMDMYKLLKQKGLPIAVAESSRVFEDIKPDTYTIPNTTFSKYLLEHPKFTEFNWELVILIPIIFEDVRRNKDAFCIYGGWRKIPNIPKEDGLLRM